MSSVSGVDLATLHNDCNIGHTLISLPKDTPLVPSSLENILEKGCLCTLKEMVFHLRLENIDITRYSKESQVKFLNRLVFERFHSTCFTDSNNTIRIKCSLSPDLEVYISNWNVDQLKECVSRFLHEANQIPVDMKLRLACLAKDHQCVKNLLKEAHTTDLKKRNMFIFYGISCGKIVDILVNSGVDVNTRDERRRTPLFYALISSLESTKRLLDRSARVTARDKCNVSVLTFFAEKMLRHNLPADVKSEGITLLRENGMSRDQMIKEALNLILCKFIQVLGPMQAASNPQRNYLNPNMLSETLNTVLGDTQDDAHADEHKNLISQLQSMQERIAAGKFDVSEVLQTFYKLGAKSSAPDSEGNTCLHYATQLLFYGVPEETVTKLCRELLERDQNSVHAKNHKKETPLLFLLSSKHIIACSETSNWSGCLQAVCTLLMEEGSELCDTTHKHESIFQLILELCQYAILLPDENRRRCIFQEMFEIFELFSKYRESICAVNNVDIQINTPLHLWASMAMKSPSHYHEKVYDDISFGEILEKILQLLRKCGVKLNDGNEGDETPLHVCRTWTAVKLLIDAGAKPDVKNSSGCTPLLAAAKRNPCIGKNSEHFFHDVTQTPKEFWKEVLKRKLDPWSADKNGDSVLSILIQKEANCLAKALIEVACELKYLQSEATGVALMIAVCKDQSSENWKLDLVKLLVDSSRSLVRSTALGNNDTPLHFSCMNILKLQHRDESVENSVHWKIVKDLLLYGADINAVGERGKSCLALSDNCPVLKGLLTTPVDYSTLPLVLGNWKQSSQRHIKQLSLVARKVNYQNVRSLYFYRDALDEGKNSGSFVFAGIDQGGREVAVKRIDKSKMLHKNGSEVVLIPSRRCDQVVQYLFCVNDENFRYIAFELMEGDLEHYLDKATGADDDSIKLCKDLVLGLQFLKTQGIIHGNINPRNVFYHNDPNLCLKIGNCKTSNTRNERFAQVFFKDETSLSNKSDVFSCGLLLHYLLSGKKHPFAPADSATKSPDKVFSETYRNIRNGNIVKIDDSLSPEATHLVHLMLDSDPSKRPSASKVLIHPFFWDNEIKKRFLHVVGNEPEISKQGRRHPLTAFESDLEGRFNVIVSRGTATWYDSPPYDNMPVTYAGMRIKRDYDHESVAGLIRFIRNAYEHLNEQPESTQRLWEGDFVLNNYFPHLVIEVYKALTTSEFHQLHESRKGIKKFFSELR